MQGRGWLFLPVEHRAAAPGPRGGRAAGRGENTISLWNPSPLMWWPKPSWRLSICAEVAWEIWELIETKQDSKDSPCKNTASKGRRFVQPLLFSLMDLVTEGCSVLFDFLNLKHLFLFLGKFTLWKRFKQIHLRALVSRRGGADNS